MSGDIKTVKLQIKHLGQSGQPIPDPVARTIAPAIITRYTSTNVVFANFKRREWFLFILICPCEISIKFLAGRQKFG
jgi:hypothetical protein